MHSIDWIQILVLGGIAGAVGQAARAIVGIKKVNDQAAAQNTNAGDLIEASRLFISLTIGFVAGALAILVMNVDAGVAEITKAQVLGLAAAGYSGADFIEGIISKAVPNAAGAAVDPSQQQPTQQTNNAAPTQTAMLTTAPGREATIDAT